MISDSPWANGSTNTIMDGVIFYQEKNKFFGRRIYNPNKELVLEPVAELVTKSSTTTTTTTNTTNTSSILTKVLVIGS